MINIKFRAWNGDFFEYASFNFKTGNLGCNFSSYVEIDTPDLFTGLMDCNGVDIYEGDIVKHMHGYSSGRVGAVEYDAELAAFSFNCSSCVVCQESGVDGGDMKVIGNIYQNKEQLK